MAVGANLGKQMTPLQMGVGVSGGAQCVSPCGEGRHCSPSTSRHTTDRQQERLQQFVQDLHAAHHRNGGNTVAASGYMDVQRGKPAARAGGITDCHFIVVQTGGEAG